jgi:phasin
MVNPAETFSPSVVPFEVPEQVRAFAEKGVSQAREQYAKFRDVAEGGNSAVEAAFAAATKGASEYSAKLFGFAQNNTAAAFDFAHDLIGVRSLSHAVDVWASHTRKQVETFASQSQELAELSRRILADTVEPLKEGASKVFRPAA